MKSKKYIIIVLCVLSLTLISCSKKQTDSIKTSTSTTINETTLKNALTYDQYEDLFNYVVSNLKIEDFKLKGSTIGDNVTIVEEDLTFNKRKYLTLDGSFNGSGAKPTDEEFIFENEKQDCQISVGMYFVNEFLGNDLIGWSTNSGFSSINLNLAKQTDYMIMSYKNCIITIHQSANNEANPEITKKFSRFIIGLLNVFAKTNEGNNIPKSVLDKVNQRVAESYTPLPEVKAWEVDLNGNKTEVEPLSKRNSLRYVPEDGYVYLFDHYNLNNCAKDWHFQSVGTCRIANKTSVNASGTYKQTSRKDTKASVSASITAKTEIKTAFIGEIESSIGITGSWEKTWVAGEEYGIEYTIPARSVIYLTNYQVGVDANGEIVYKKISKQSGLVGYYYESAGGTVLDPNDINIELSDTEPIL